VAGGEAGGVGRLGEAVTPGHNKKIGAAGVILDIDGGVLLVKQTYGRLSWELPGGGAEAGESPDDTVLRGVQEETGLAVAVLHLTGYYYYDAAADFLHFVCRCEVRDGDGVPRADLTEVSECRYSSRDALPRPISDFAVRRIEDAVAGIKFSCRSGSGRLSGWNREPRSVAACRRWRRPLRGSHGADERSRHDSFRRSLTWF
jgi:8-oxo-dGTP diphosphatase